MDCFFLICFFPDLPFQFRQLNRYIKLPINSHKNQEIITLQQSKHLQPCAKVTLHTGRISNYIRKGCPNHAHNSRYPSRVSGCHPILRPATAGQLRGDATQQDRERRMKARCPLSSSKLGYMRHLIHFVPYPSTQLLAGARGFLSFGQAQSQKDRGEQEEGGHE